MKINELNLKNEIKLALEKSKIEELMPIQEKCIPIALKGENIIGEAATGTGKTFAFVLPILEKIDFEQKDIQSIILAPTRELAQQIEVEIQKLGRFLKIRTATLVGGMSMAKQIADVKKQPHIIIGTVGRVVDHLENKKLDISKVKFFVLDEADEMLKEGFIEDIIKINDLTNEDKQTFLFSATISNQILALTSKIMKNYLHISIKDATKANINITQQYVITKEKNKFSVLTKFLDMQNNDSTIIFGRTKKRTDELANALIECGYKANCIHGDLSQDQRNHVIRDFKNGNINILVATDVAARGLDIQNIQYVYNFDLPEQVEFYVHRIGRTGRANNVGTSITFLRDIELPHLQRIMDFTKMEIQEIPVPSFKEVRQTKYKLIPNSIKDKLDKIDTSLSQDFADELINEFGANKLVSVLIESYLNNQVKDITLTGEPPVKVKKSSNSKGSRRNPSRNRNFNRDRNDNNRNRDRNKNRKFNDRDNKNNDRKYGTKPRNNNERKKFDN